jgi:hypothetical protein
LRTSLLQVGLYADMSEINPNLHGVSTDRWIRCPSHVHMITDPVRMRSDHALALVTNLAPSEMAAGDVALLYKERWRIEVFFRWVKCLLGCRHWFAQSPRGDPATLSGAHRGAAPATLHGPAAEPADAGADSILSVGRGDSGRPLRRAGAGARSPGAREKNLNG